ncbi:antibiotic biosynthesis monooxygenase [Phormidium sp. CLA17]|uniref:antibiotic biosynthesis monooxygenase family protein n=1 Tax=Leptolyngbya sp. Cla-17 TaxID=2803751 RepID=UPI0014918563|nr:antibiotic biosynthesis monooxygenase [Leptolyngbya sp. Cla-17]MBM0740169.1 antibiotic biosynthesis monooxygenase [Leptolyngbya sp. Cla-17]
MRESLHDSYENREVPASPILEAVMLQIRPGTANAFEAAFRQASPIIASMKGYCGHDLHRCLETPEKYLLLVRWETLEDHTVGFRGSPDYQTWKQLLHPFYDPFPVVEHFEVLTPFGAS